VSAQRGDVWLIDFGDPVGREQAGVRPGLVMSADALNESPAGVVIVVPITTARRGLPSHIEIDSAQSGLDDVSYAKCEDVKSISDHRLRHHLGRVDRTVISRVERVLRFLLDF
jgi:mRNA interferase MazF